MTDYRLASRPRAEEIGLRIASAYEKRTTACDPLGINCKLKRWLGKQPGVEQNGTGNLQEAPST